MTEQIILTDINAFYEEHIKGHTPQELEIGNTFALDAYDGFLSSDQYHSLYDYEMSEDFIKRCISLSGLPREKVITCINLANDFSFWSDWHKDEYGFRPRHL